MTLEDHVKRILGEQLLTIAAQLAELDRLRADLETARAQSIPAESPAEARGPQRLVHPSA